MNSTASVLRFLAFSICLLVLAKLRAQGPVAEALDAPELAVVSEAGSPASEMFRPAGGVAGAAGGTALLHEGRISGASAKLAVTVQGPGEFVWRWQLAGDAAYEEIKCTAESAWHAPFPGGYSAVRTISGEAAWREENMTLPAGPVTLRWSSRSSACRLPVPARAWLDDFRFTPAAEAPVAEVSVAEALEGGALAWQIPAEVKRTGVPAFAGADDFLLLEKPPLPMRAEVLSATLPPGWLVMKYQGSEVSFQVPPDAVYAREPWAFSNSWRALCFYTAGGGDFRVSQTGSAFPIRLKVESAQHFPEPVSVAEALDAPGLTWTVSPGAAAWTPLPIPFFAADGVDMLMTATTSTNVSVSTTVTGPAEVRVRAFGEVTFSLGGTFQHPTPATPASWQERLIYVPQGAWPLQWTTSNGALDDVRVTPLPLLPVEQAVDSSAFTWTGVANNTWFTLPEATSYDGTDLLRGLSGTATAAWAGESAVSFRWRNAAASTLNGSIFSLPGGFNKTPWLPVYVELPAGTHRLSIGAGDYDTFALHPQPRPLREALNLETTGVLALGNALWSVTEGAEFSGGAALASPALRHGESALLRLVPNGGGAARVTFRWKAAAADAGAVATAGSTEGTTAVLMARDVWQTETFTVSSPPVWTVTPTGPAGCAAGAIILDDVRVETAGPLTTAHQQTLGLAGANVTVSGATALPVLSLPAESRSGNGALALTGGFDLNVPLPGPAELSFWWRMEQGFEIPEIWLDGTLLCQMPALEGWQQAVVSVQSPGPHTVAVKASLTAPRRMFMEGMALRSRNDASSLFTTLGGAPVDWALPATGTGAAFPDTATLRDGSAGVRMGDGAPLLAGRTGGAGVLRGWWRRELNGGPLRAARFQSLSSSVMDELRRDGFWQPFALRVAASPAGIRFDAVSGVPGPEASAWWLQGLVFEAGSLSAGETLGSAELPWAAQPPALWSGVFTAQNTRHMALTEAAPAGGAKLSLPLTGPGFLLQARRTAYVPALTFDGAAQVQSDFMPVPAGNLTARWSVPEGSPAGPVLYGPVRFLATGTVAPANGMDLSEPYVAQVAAPGMTAAAHPAEAYDGEDFAISAAMESTTPQVLAEFTVAGPGRLTWQARLAGAAGAVFTHALNGAAVSSTMTHTGAWQGFSLDVPAGSHSVSFSGRLGDGITGRGWLMLDQVIMAPGTAAEVSVAVALDAPGTVWRERAASPWQVRADPAATGGSLAVSPWLGGEEHAWLETEVTGPGVLFVKVSSALTPSGASGGAFIQQLQRGSTVTSFGGDLRHYIADSGPQTLRFFFRGPANGGAKMQFMLDAFAFAPLSGNPAFQEALNVPALTFGGTGWSGIDAGVRGKMVVMAGAASPAREMLITTPGAGTLSWNWINSPSPGSLAMVKLLDGLSIATLASGQTHEWVRRSEFVLPRQNELALRATGHNAAAVALAGGFTWEPALPVTPEEALDIPGQTWTSPDWTAWEAVQLPSANSAEPGEDVLISRNAAHGSTAAVTTTVSGPVAVDFDWSVNSEAGDRLEFLADGVVRASISGLSGSSLTGSWGGWQVNGNGPHTLTWRYVKSAATHGGEDTARLYGVSLTPLLSIPLSQALDASGLTFTAGGSTAQRFVSAADPGAPRGGSAAVFYGGAIVSSPPRAWLETTLTGPGLLSFSCRGSCGLLVNGTAQSSLDAGYLSLAGSGGWSRHYLRLTDAAAKLIRIEMFAAQSAPAVDDLRFERFSSLAAGGNWTTSEPPWSGTAETLYASEGSSEAWVERTLQGPGKFTAAVSTNNGSGRILLDDVAALTLTSATENLSLLVPPGEHCIRFVRLPHATMHVSGVQFTAAQAPWLPDLLDAPQFWYRTAVPEDITAGTTNPLQPGNEYARWGSVPAGAVQVMVPAAGRMAVSYSRPAAMEPYHGGGFNQGTAESATAAGQWAQAYSPFYQMPGWATLGAVQLTSSAGVPLSSVVTADVHLDALRFLPAPALSLAAAADTDSLNFQPSPGWAGLEDHVRSPDGTDAIFATALPGSGPQPLRATLTGPATLTWSWKTAAGNLGAFVSGQQMATIASSSTVSRAMIQFGPGPHTVEWRITSTSGAAMVLDQFTLTPGSPERDRFGPLVPAIASAVSVFAQWTVLIPGPSLENYGPYTKLHLHSGVLSFSLPLPASPEALGLELITEIPVAEALEWDGPLTLEGTWKGYRCASGDFAWSGNSARLTVSTDGPGVFSWGGGGDNQTVVVNGATGYGFSSQAPHRIPFQEAGSRTLTFSYNQWFLETLTWSPYTPDNDFAAWAAHHGLDPAAPAADADGDGWSQFHEFSFHGAPLSADNGGAIRPVLVERRGNTWPAVEFLARLEAGVRYELQTHTGSGWQAEPGAFMEFPAPGEDPLLLRLVSERPVTSAWSRMLRVRAVSGAGPPGQ